MEKMTLGEPKTTLAGDARNILREIESLDGHVQR